MNNLNLIKEDLNILKNSEDKQLEIPIDMKLETVMTKTNSSFSKISKSIKNNKHLLLNLNKLNLVYKTNKDM